MYVDIPPVLQCWITILCSAIDFTVFCIAQSSETEYMIPLTIEFGLPVLRIDFNIVQTYLASQ